MKNATIEKSAKVTPLMQQYFAIKSEYPDALLLFQVGDFYELFFEDAQTAAHFLAITLTKRGKSEGTDIPLCGIPVHALHHYLLKLIKGGFKVAIADQMTKPVPGQVVERKVTRYITPGTVLDEYLMDQKTPSYFCLLYPGKESWGILFTELLTAQMHITEIANGAYRSLETELSRFLPDEIILSSNAPATLKTSLKEKGFLVSSFNAEDVDENQLEEWAAEMLAPKVNQEILQNSTLVKTLHILNAYVKKHNQEAVLENLGQMILYEAEDYLILDSATQKNLDLVPLNGQKKEHTLLGILDHAVTAMGSRLIKKWILRPLMNKKQIEQRSQFSFFLKNQILLLKKIRSILEEFSDIERIIGRIALQRATPQDYGALARSLLLFPDIQTVLCETQETEMGQLLLRKIPDFSSLAEFLLASINLDSSEEGIIKESFDFELDQQRTLVRDSQRLLLELEQREVQKTGLSTLKLKYTDLYGYSFELSKNQSTELPDYFVLQQSLSNKNRYVTAELKELERAITAAHANIQEIEKKVFQRIVDEVMVYLGRLRIGAQVIATCDALASFAQIGYLYHYSLPSFNDEGIISIEGGRHPVVERTTKTFVPNDTTMNRDSVVHIVTGPNMGGKSTYLRQVGLIHIMAQIGSLVPAQKVSLALLDRLFTRIGSGDDLAQGKSTFLVEMEETGVICTQATSKSLVILDEVGRGTSTYDGMALAHAIVEFLAKTLKTRALFATHYHELTRLEHECSGVINYYCAAEKKNNNLVFFHTVKRGTSAGSFGIEVARIARLPESIVERAVEVLQSWDSFSPIPVKQQETTFEPARVHPVIEQIQKLSVDSLSPRQALDVLYSLKQLI